MFCESTLPSHFATVAGARFHGREVEICNAGHPAPLVARGEARPAFQRALSDQLSVFAENKPVPQPA